ncbi:Do family serine endopeptidase, partial [Candidatus Poribacteria bacterium]|nr:Do family serine endopeptidase [Candidatus Poribacteria bacterium]
MSKKSLIIPIASISVILLIAFGMLLFGGSNEANSKPTTTNTTTINSTEVDLSGLRSLNAAFIKVAKEVNPSVVNISTKSEIKTPSRRSQSRRPDNEWDPFRDFFGDEFFKRFFDTPQSQTKRSLGSGVIISEDGYILTNSHVVSDADEIKVTLDGKKEYDAKIIGADKDTDVAVIKIDANKLPFARLGDSDKLQVGEWVLAIGNPLRLSHTVTAGIISAIGRSNVGLANYENFIQTDASINPGNSGGPLVNIEGEVIGINTAIATAGTPGNIGIGFAIPINMAIEIKDQLTKKGKVTRGWLGIQLQDIDSDIAEKYGLKEAKGVLVAMVFDDSPAGKAGIKAGDLIIEFNGKNVEDGSHLKRLVASAGPNESVEVKVIRDKKERVFDVKLS